MNIQIKIQVCRACLKPAESTNLVEYSSDSAIMILYQEFLNIEPSSELPRLFCSKCVSKLKISTEFKSLARQSECYLVTQIKDFVAKFTKSLPTNSISTVQHDSEIQDSDDPDIEDLLVEGKSERARSTELQLSAPTIAEPSKPSTPPKVFRQTPEKSAEKNQVVIKKVEKPKQQLMKIEKVEEAMNDSKVRDEKEYMDVDSSGLYTEEEQLDDDGNIFGEEIYDIMEIEGESSENIYLDETGKQVLGDDEGEFILVNFKSSNEDLTEKDTQFVVEELYEDDITDSKPTVSRKKHVNRMPREIIEKYAQSTDDNQHICTKCVKVFSTRTNLIRHIQSHDGNKAYVCQVCKKGFTQSGSLKQHMYIHSGERPYKCQYCDRAFTQGKTLKFHLRRHTEEKPFICTECNSAFRQRDGLKRHLKSRHNIELKYDRNNQLSDSTDKIVAFIKFDEETDTKSKDSEEAEESKKN